MASLIFALAIALFFLFVAFDRKGASGFFGSVAFIWILLCACGVLPKVGLEYLQDPSVIQPQVEVKWRPGSVILVLTGGSVRQGSKFLTSPLVQSRVLETVRLFRSCREAVEDCRVLVTGGDPAQNGEAEATTLKRELVGLGVTDAAISTEIKSRNTRENILYSRRLLTSQGYDQVVLVTSGFHMKRALLSCERSNLIVVPAPSDVITAKLSWRPTAYNVWLADLALHEFGGMVAARLR